MKKQLFFLLCFILITHCVLIAQTACPTLQGTLSNLRSNTNASYCYAITTDYGTGNWYRDDSDVTSSDNTGTVVVDGNLKRWKRIYTGAWHVAWWGAIGTDTSSMSVTANESALTSCFSYAQPYQTVYFDPGNYKFNLISITTTNLTITGSKANLIGILELVNSSAATIFNSTITGLTFSNQNAHSINLKNCRNLRITDNVFNNCSKAIYVEQYYNSTAAATKHSTGLIEMKGNYFNNVGYCFYADRSTNANATWQTVNDCTFDGNVADFCDTTAVYCQGIDGLKFQNNTIFTPTDSTGTYPRRLRKLNHLRIADISDYVIVSNNNLFESGHESILVTGCKDLNVTGNNFAWCGQDSVYSVISQLGTIQPMTISVTGNIFNDFSGNVLQLADTTYGNINVSGNDINYANVFTDYFGSTSLAGIRHYIVYAPSQSNRISEKNIFTNISNLTSTYTFGLNTKFDIWGSFGVEGYICDTIATTGSSEVAVAGLYDSALNTSTLSGTLTITAKSANTSYAKTSTYVLLINQATSTATDVVTVIGEAGLISGVSSNDPSFTFTAHGNKLWATPVGSTSGTFQFYVMSKGDLVVTGH